MCELTQGYTKICDSAGGSKRVFLYSLRDSTGLSNYAIEPNVIDGEVTAMQLKPGKFAYAFNVEPETTEGFSNSIGESANGASAFEHSTTINLHGNTSLMIADAIKMCKGRVGVIIELNDGTFEIYHFTNGAKAQRNRSIGKAFEDMNGSVIALTSKQTLPEMKISSLLVNSLIQP
jgi:hypothetical protein